MIGAVERGYRVILVADAICSSARETHCATLEVCSQRFGQQIETAGLAEVMRIGAACGHWLPAPRRCGAGRA